jgi:membrane-bound metal-dependent hydrolase YbcI (DUF457 family)
VSAALTHLAVGLLLGLGLRLPARYLPLAAFLALAPDLDHLHLYLPVPFLETRVTFHNLLVCVVLPALVYATLAWRGAPRRWQQLGAASPVLLTSHLLLDMLPFDIGSAKVALLYPFKDGWYTAAPVRGNAADPTAFSSITVVMLLLAVLVAFSLLATQGAARGASDDAATRGRDATGGGAARPRLAWRRLGRPAAFVGLSLALFPALAAGGYVIPASTHPDIALAVVEPTARWPDGTLTALVYHVGGASLPAGRVQLEVLADGERVALQRAPKLLEEGQRWVAAVQLPPEARGARELHVRLVADADGHEYARMKPRVELGHVDVPLRLASFEHDGRQTALLVVRNDGDAAVPAGALRLTVRTPTGATLLFINEMPLDAGDPWTRP